jgi:hypothetical protein
MILARPTSWRPFSLAVWLTSATLAGLVAFTAMAGLVDAMPLAWVVALAAGITTIAWLRRRPNITEALAAVPRWARRLFVAGAVLLISQLLVLSFFIVDPNLAVWPDRPWRPWQSAHSCVSAYWMAATAIGQTPNVYADKLYSMPQADASARRRPRRLGPFNIDVYEYPPTFLPLPRLLSAVTADFWQFRRVWFALNLAGVVLCLVAIARRVDLVLGSDALWLAPFALAAPAMVGTLQAGNVQLLVIAMSAVAMLLFERGRHAAGGVLLAYGVVSKLFPAVLCLYMLLRRDWRALAWTAAWSLAILGVTYADVGPAPFAAFFEHLPKLLSGEAFPAFRSPNAMGINESVPGIVFKIGLLGGPSLGFGAARVVGWGYTLVVLAATVWLALRRPPDRREPLVWIAILSLATLRSPFLPTYGAFPSLWLATLVAATEWNRPAIRWMAIAWWIALAFNLGQGYATPPVNALWTFVHTVGAFVVVALAVRSEPEAALARAADLGAAALA